MAIDKNKTMVIPDAIHHTDTSETLEYIQGWNDCRQAMLAEQPAQQEPVTEAQIVAGARVLNRRMADMCGIDAEDQWKQYGEDFRADARAVLEAAHNIKENT